MKPGRKSSWSDEIRFLARKLKDSGISYSMVAKELGVKNWQAVAMVQHGQHSNRADACQECGYEYNLIAHHLNYSTNETITLCGQCHAKRHPIRGRRSTERIATALEQLKDTEAATMTEKEKP